ncbi:hypothetical protein GOV10_00240 [Candidatus Woesearchaeota archaeon]|nr:hypothetical protein [Candidatus Woesearchaeota archaeon]
MANVFDNQGIGSTVTIDGAASTGELPVQPIKHTVLRLADAQAGSATNTMGTVGAGKVWRIIGLAMSDIVNASGGAGVVTINLNGNGYLTILTSSTATYGSGGHSEHIMFPYDACPVLTVGQTVQALYSTATNAYTYCYYVEEDV